MFVLNFSSGKQKMSEKFVTNCFKDSWVYMGISSKFIFFKMSSTLFWFVWLMFSISKSFRGSTFGLNLFNKIGCWVYGWGHSADTESRQQAVCNGQLQADENGFIRTIHYLIIVNLTVLVHCIYDAECGSMFTECVAIL